MSRERHEPSQVAGLPMPALGQARSATHSDTAWRTAFRLGFPLARFWWCLRRPRHEGALVAVYVDEVLLVVRSSYRVAWNFPSGSVLPGKTPEAGAQCEPPEEIGLAAYQLLPVGEASGVWDGATIPSAVLRITTGPAA
jgi:8-oxo-dGTP diphosphatase